VHALSNSAGEHAPRALFQSPDTHAAAAPVVAAGGRRAECSIVSSVGCPIEVLGGSNQVSTWTWNGGHAGVPWRRSSGGEGVSVRPDWPERISAGDAVGRADWLD